MAPGHGELRGTPVLLRQAVASSDAAWRDPASHSPDENSDAARRQIQRLDELIGVARRTF
jgi:hypothetical protein